MVRVLFVIDEAIFNVVFVLCAWSIHLTHPRPATSRLIESRNPCHSGICVFENIHHLLASRRSLSWPILAKIIKRRRKKNNISYRRHQTERMVGCIFVSARRRTAIANTQVTVLLLPFIKCKTKPPVYNGPSSIFSNPRNARGTAYELHG